MSLDRSPTGATLAGWIARWSPPAVTVHDRLDTSAGETLADLLSWAARTPPTARPEAGSVPALHHWAHFARWQQRADLGADGHPAEGGFLPPVPERTRMFAGGRCEMHRPLLTGVPAVATSDCADVRVKQGRSGEMLFVTVRTTVSQDGRVVLVEHQDLVYRSGFERRRSGRGAGPEPTPDGPVGDDPGEGSLRLDPATLFRFSALTGNSHRIHYDADYARDIEGYPGLVVHGPLLVLLILECVAAQDARPIARVEYRLQRPVFLTDAVSVVIDSDAPARRVRASIVDAAGQTRAFALVSHVTSGKARPLSR